MSRNKEWKVGDRIQKSEWVDGKEIITTGAISDVVNATREVPVYSSYRRSGTKTETYLDKISVKWDDGREETGVSPWHVSPEDSQMEREFRIKAAEVGELIQAKLSEASKALDEAEAIAEEHGISFSSDISPLSQTYKATSAGDKWPDISSEFMDEITDSYGEYDGWQHSA